MEREELLSKGISLLGIHCDKNHIEKLSLFLDEIELWNSDSKRNKKGVGLVRAERRELVIRHVLDSLAGLSVLRTLPHNSIADLGSGAGFPGIPLALFLPESGVTLIERSGRKAAFLRNAAAVMGLDNVRIQEASLHQATGEYELVVFRALKRIGTILDDVLRLTAPEGVAVAYKGKSLEINEEISSLHPYDISVHPVDVPFLEEERNLILIRFKTVS